MRRWFVSRSRRDPHCLAGSHLPQADDSEHHQVGKKKRSHGRSAKDEIVEGVDRWALKISRCVKHEPPEPDASLSDQKGGAEINEQARHADKQWHTKKAD